MASPIDTLVLYIATKIIKIIIIKFNKNLLNKIKKIFVIKNKNNNKQIKNVNNPTKKLILLRENRSFNNVVICIL